MSNLVSLQASNAKIDRGHFLTFRITSVKIFFDHGHFNGKS